MCTNYEFALHTIMEKFRDNKKPITVNTAINGIGNRQDLLIYQTYLDGVSVRKIVNNLIANGYLTGSVNTQNTKEELYSLSELGVYRFTRYAERVSKEATV